MAHSQKIRRGDIFTVDFEPVRGTEQGKMRPALVIQNNIGNRFSSTIIVAGITSGKDAKYPINVAIKAPEGGLRNDSIILLSQIRSVHLSRFGRYWGSASRETMEKVDEAIVKSLGLHESWVRKPKARR